jgi:hypothetical protein
MFFSPFFFCHNLTHYLSLFLLSLHSHTSCRSIEAARGLFTLPRGLDVGDHFEQAKCMQKVLMDLYGKKEGLVSRPAGVRPNMHVRVAAFSMTFDDDAFEMALYRSMALQQRLATEHAHYFDELEAFRHTVRNDAAAYQAKLSAVQESHAREYCQRAAQAATVSGPKLFDLAAQNVTLSLLHDDRFSGSDALIARMCEMDVAPRPAGGFAHTLLLGSKVAAGIDALSITLRDYQAPLVALRAFRASGGLVLAEPAAIPTAIRSDRIVPGPGEDHTVYKGMTPIKVYHDLDVTVDSVLAAWGPCWEGVLTDVADATDMLTNASVDPSPPLPWYDKARLLRHGPISLRAGLVAFNLLFDTNPQVVRKSLEVTLSGATVRFAHSRASIVASTLLARTISPTVLRACPLLSAEGVDLEVDLQWLTQGDSRCHHDVFATAPEHVREKAGHDSFASYRSRGVGIRATLRTPKDPIVLLHGATLGWLKQLDAALSEPTRPTRRGKAFTAVVPPLKTPFGRHMASVTLALRFPGLAIVYFSDADRKHCLVGQGVSCACVCVSE